MTERGIGRRAVIEILQAEIVRMLKVGLQHSELGLGRRGLDRNTQNQRI